MAYLHKSRANSPSVHTFNQGTSAADFVPSWPPLLFVEVSPSESQGLDLHGRNNYSVRQRVRETAWEGKPIFVHLVQQLFKYFILNKFPQVGQQPAPQGVVLAFAENRSLHPPGTEGNTWFGLSLFPLVTLILKTSSAISGQAPKYFKDD